MLIEVWEILVTRVSSYVTYVMPGPTISQVFNLYDYLKCHWRSFYKLFNYLKEDIALNWHACILNFIVIGNVVTATDFTAIELTECNKRKGGYN